MRAAVELSMSRPGGEFKEVLVEVHSTKNI
jgi:hypothetical protein